MTSNWYNNTYLLEGTRVMENCLPTVIPQRGY